MKPVGCNITRQMVTAAAILIITGALPGCGYLSPRFQAVTAQYFLIVDKDNRTRGQFGADDDGVGVILLDSAGKQRVIVVAKDDLDGSSYVSLRDRNANVRGEFYVSTRRGRVLLLDNSGKQRIDMLTTEDTTYLALFDATGKLVSMTATLGESGRTYFALYDSNGNIGWIQSVRRDGDTKQPAKEVIEAEAKRVMESLKSGWLKALLISTLNSLHVAW